MSRQRRPKQIDWPRVLGPLAAPPHGLAGEELQELERAMQRHPRRAVRVHPAQAVQSLPFAVEPVPWCRTEVTPAAAPHATRPGLAARSLFLAESDVRPGAFLHYAAGDYYIQDAGSLLAMAVAEIEPGQHVCDACAAPGGKSTAIVELLAGEGWLVANEVIGSRLPVLGLALARAGYGNYLVTNFDVEQWSALAQDAFDCVVVDAPCTGQSMVARGKQSLAAYSASQIEHSRARQHRILRAAAQMVKPGGRLVYSTCTFSFDENEGMVADFLQHMRGWSLRRWPALEAWETPGFPGCYRVWPHRDQCAGAFAAALVRGTAAPTDGDVVGGALEGRLPPVRRREWLPVQDCPADMEWLDAQPDNPVRQGAAWYRQGSHLHRFCDQLPPEWIMACESGVWLASGPPDRLEPMYAGARLVAPELVPHRLLELDDPQAVRYVAGESLPWPNPRPEWVLVQWRGRRLAWGKLAGGALKNHFPKPLRQPAARLA